MPKRKLSVNITPASLLVTLLSVVFLFATIALGHFVMVVVNVRSLNYQTWQLENFAVEHQALTSLQKPDAHALENNLARQEKTRARLGKVCEGIFAGLSQTEKDRVISELQSATGSSETGFAALMDKLLHGDWQTATAFINGTLAPLRKGTDIQKTFPLWCLVVGLAFVYASRFTSKYAIQTYLGVTGGNFIWIFLEYVLIYGAQRMGVARDGGSPPEYILLKFSVPFLIVMTIFFLFKESSRCNLLVWLRKYVPLTREPLKPSRPTNFGPLAAWEYIFITWFFYVALMLVYDNRLIGLRSPVTYALFFANITATFYLIYKLLGYRLIGPNLRYAIPTMIIFWNNLELLGKWGFFKEPWLHMNIPVMIIIGLGFIISTYLIICDIRNPQPAGDASSASPQPFELT